MTALSVLEWAKERHANTLRIAASKRADRAGWLEDAAYWCAIVERLTGEAAALARAEQAEAQAMRGQPRITTRCPSCGGQTLFVGKGGHLTCSLIGCKSPGVGSAIEALQAALAAAQAERDAAWAEISQLRHTHTKEVAEAQAEAKAMRHERDIEIHARVEAERAAEESEIAFKAAHKEMDEAEAQLAAAQAERDHYKGIIERDGGQEVLWLITRDATVAALSEARRVLDECKGRIGDWIVGVGAFESNEEAFALMHQIDAVLGHPSTLTPEQIAAVLAQEEQP